MPNIYQLAAEFRGDLDDLDFQAASRMTNRYGHLYSRLRGEIDKTVAAIQAAEEKDPNLRNLLARQDRLSTLLAETKKQINAYADYSSEHVQRTQASAIAAAKKHALKMMGVAVYDDDTPTVLGRFQALPDDALLDLVGFTQLGSPLHELFRQLDGGTTILERTIFEGLALGKGARAIAAEAKKALALPLARSLTIARTETLRAYRESTRRIYEANGHLLDGWQWFSARDRRSCAACWAMHGTTHTPQERLDGHPNCRCSMVPIVKGQDPFVTPAADEFARLPEKDQRFVLGRERFKLWKDGQVALGDLVVQVDDPRWGTMRRQASVKEALAMAAKRKKGLEVDRDKPATQEEKKPRRARGRDEQLAAIRDLVAAKPDDPETLVKLGELIRDRAEGRLDALYAKIDDLDRKAQTITKQMDDLFDQQFNSGSDDDLWNRLEAQRKKLRAQRERVYTERDKLAASDLKNQSLRDVLAEVRPMGLRRGDKMTWWYRKYAGADARFEKEYKKMLDRQLDYLPSEWIRDIRSRSGGMEYEVVPQSAPLDEQRGHYHPYYHRVRMTWYNTDATAIHELVHGVENTRPALVKAEKLFYEWRTAGEPVRRMMDEYPGMNYRPSEIFRRDRFLTDYQGKDYGGDSWELATMAAEGVFRPDPARNAIDEEMRNWMLGVLAAV